MHEPWELTDKEAAAEGRRMAPRRDDADRADAYLYSEAYALANANDEELATLPREEAELVRDYLAQHNRAASTES